MSFEHSGPFFLFALLDQVFALLLLGLDELLNGLLLLLVFVRGLSYKLGGSRRLQVEDLGAQLLNTAALVQEYVLEVEVAASSVTRGDRLLIFVALTFVCVSHPWQARM